MFARVAAVACLLAAACSLPLESRADRRSAVSPAQRAALIRRAQVWTPTDIPHMDVVAGPDDHGFPPNATVACDFVPKDFDGEDPKFACAIDRDDVVKVRYGRDNGEVYAGVAATRLLWALGFGADPLYPVRVICRGCPERMQADGMATERSITFEVAAIERRYPGLEIDADGPREGWAWPELNLVDPVAGGAPLAHRDALKLLAAMLMHTDSKPVQQRLLCKDAGATRADLASCARPFMIVHDLGHTFAHPRVFRGGAARAALDEWSATPVWADARRCVANVTPAHDGTLDHPAISESGRRFLAGLLAQLTPDQVRGIFRVARFDRDGHAGDSIEGWASAFERKRQEIAAARCPGEG